MSPPRLTWWNPDAMTFDAVKYAAGLIRDDLARGFCVAGMHPAWARRLMTARLAQTRFA